MPDLPLKRRSLDRVSSAMLVVFVARKTHDARVTSESGAQEPSSARRYSGWQAVAGVVLHDFRCHLACVRVSLVSHVCNKLCRLSRSWLSVCLFVVVEH